VTWAGVREVLQSNCRVMNGRKKSVVTLAAAEPGEVGESDNDGAEVEEIKRIIEISTLLYPSQIIHLKAFYGWQQTVEEHYKRCSTARWGAAARLEHKWAEWMVASQEVGSIGGGWSSRRRRRRAREAEDRVRDENEHGVDMNADAGTDRDDATSSGINTPNGGRQHGRRRARSGGCTVM
jgi:F-box and leucine-rich repeat protein 2/20